MANENPPKLKTHDRYGHRVDEVEFHPYWHDLMRTAVSHGLAGAPWAAAVGGDAHAHVRRAVGYFGWTQVEMGHACPVTMTYAAVPALRRTPELVARFEPGLTSTAYEFGLSEPGGKAGLIAGMGMTEKHGGSDVRANTTRAVPQPDGSYALTGHKWFTSAPMSDLFLVLAQLEEGVSCFAVPRVSPTAAATSSASSGSRTSSATASTPPARSSSSGRRAGSSASPAEACRRSSRWSTPRGWTACWARRRPCGRR